MTYKELLNSLEMDGTARRLNVMELQKLKDVMLACYRDVAAVCRKYGLAVMLGGGSALGAVRHKGYIPWDDDFDLMMPRADYDRLREVFESELGDRYVLNAPNYSKTPTNRFPKILIKGTRFVELGESPEKDTNNIKIDVFIIENVPDNFLLRLLKGLYCTVLMLIAGCVGTYEERNDPLTGVIMRSKEGKRILRRRLFIGKFFAFSSYGIWCNRVDRACQYKKDSQFVSIPTGRKHYFGEIRKKSTFIPVSHGVFEGEDVCLPHDADDYLSNLYGNYMQVPPEEKRERHLISEIAFADGIDG